MKTRFDNDYMWVTADHRHLQITEMETTHLMNTLRMFVHKPFVVASLLIKDFEAAPVKCSSEAWTPTSQPDDNIVSVSINTVTSMTAEQLTEYAVNSPLGQAMCKELNRRGANLNNLFQMWIHENDVIIKEKPNNE